MQERRTTAWVADDEERLSNLDVSIGGEKEFIKAKTSPCEHLQDSVAEIEEKQYKQALRRQSRQRVFRSEKGEVCYLKEVLDIVGHGLLYPFGSATTTLAL